MYYNYNFDGVHDEYLQEVIDNGDQLTSSPGNWDIFYYCGTCYSIPKEPYCRGTWYGDMRHFEKIRREDVRRSVIRYRAMLES